MVQVLSGPLVSSPKQTALSAFTPDAPQPGATSALREVEELLDLSSSGDAVGVSR